MTQKPAEIGAARLREFLETDPLITEKKMFGGNIFLLNGNMLCGYSSKGQFMVRIGKELEATANKFPGTENMDFSKKKMGGMLFVDDAAIPDRAALENWVNLARKYVSTLPSK